MNLKFDKAIFPHNIDYYFTSVLSKLQLKKIHTNAINSDNLVENFYPEIK